MRSIRARSARARALAGLLAAGAALGACKEPYPGPLYRGAGARAPHRGGVLRFAYSSDVRTLDPHLAYDEYSGGPVRMMFDTLVDYLPGSAELAPSLAERWEVSPDGRTYTFHLRDNVRFHNGRLLVADDVRKSFERLLDPRRVPCPNTSFYHLIDGFDDFQEHRAPHLRGIEVLDPRTVRFTLTQADQTFLNAMAMPFAAPIPVEVADRLGRDAFAQNPVGTGPFVLERWETGARIVLRRNPSYWRADRPWVDQLIIETSLEAHLQFMRFQHGDLEYLHNASISTAEYVWIRERASWAPYTHLEPDNAMFGVGMNTERPPFNNVHVRRAVAFAIDREALARAYNDRIRPLGGVYPPGLPGYDPHLPDAQTYDPARARQELALAGYPHGLPDEQEMWIQEGGGSRFGQFVQSDLARVGIRVRLRPASFAVFLDTTQRRGAVGISFQAWSQDFPDPSNFIETLFGSRSIQPESSQNTSFYSNRQLDALLDAARVEPDRARRLAMYQQAERIVVADAPWAFVYYPTRIEVLQPYVQGYRSNPVFAHDFRDTWLDLPRRRFATREAWFDSRGGRGATALATLLGAARVSAP